EQVADEGRLDGPALDGPSGGVRGPPADELVPRAATDDMDRLELAAGDAPETVDGLRMLQREALEDAADDGTVVGGHRLPRPFAGLDDAGRYVAGLGEGRIVGIDERAQRLGQLREPNEVVDRIVAAGERPDPGALVQQPQACDVAEDPDRPCDAALVGQVRA